MSKETFMIIHPRRASSRLALSLVKDAGGTVIEKSKLGLIVQVKRSVAKSLDLLQILHTNSCDILMSSRVSSAYARSAAAHY